MRPPGSFKIARRHRLGHKTPASRSRGRPRVAIYHCPTKTGRSACWNRSATRFSKVGRREPAHPPRIPVSPRDLPPRIRNSRARVSTHHAARPGRARGAARSRRSSRDHRRGCARSVTAHPEKPRVVAKSTLAAFGARGRTRTCMALGQAILSRPRLPIPPPGQRMPVSLALIGAEGGKANCFTARKSRS